MDLGSVEQWLRDERWHHAVGGAVQAIR